MFAVPLDNCTVYTYTVRMNLARVRVDPSSTLPVTRQIVDQIRVLLVHGTLPPGFELPSVRRVAVELGVHHNTVAEAYRQLAAEGWLDLKHGRGARVIERVAPPKDPGLAADFRERLRQMAAQMHAAGLSRANIATEFHKIAEVFEK